MSTETKKKDLTIVHLVVILACMFLFRLIPAPAPITPYGMAVLGIFLGLVYGWTFFGMLWPSLLGMVALAFTDYGTFTQVAVGSWGNANLFMLIVGTLACSAIGQSNSSKLIIAKLLNMNLLKGRPLVIITALFLISSLMGFLAGSVVTAIILIPLTAQLFESLGYKKGDKFVVMSVVGILTACNLTIGMFPFLGWGLMTAATVTASTGYAFPSGAWFVCMLAFVVMFDVCFPFLMKLCGCDFSKLQNADFAEMNKEFENGLDKRQKLVLGGMLVFILCAVTLSFLPAESIFGQFNTRVTSAGLMSVLMVFYLLVKVDGKPLLDMKEAAANYFWDLTILFAIAILVSNVMTSEGTGISIFCATAITPIMAKLGNIGFLAVLCIVTIFLTNVANNMAVCFIMLNIICMMFNNGVVFNMPAAVLMVTMLSLIGIVTPASSVIGAFIHSHPGVTPTAVYKWATVTCLFSVILMLVIIVPLSSLLF